MYKMNFKIFWSSQKKKGFFLKCENTKLPLREKLFLDTERVQKRLIVLSFSMLALRKDMLSLKSQKNKKYIGLLAYNFYAVY